MNLIYPKTNSGTGRGSGRAAWPMMEDRDCIGRGKLTENQMMGMVKKVREQGLLNQEPPECSGRGIVIAGGGKYLSHAWAVCQHLRTIGWEEGIQVWHLGKQEMPDWAIPRFQSLAVELVDALEVRKAHPMRKLGGWELKIFCAMNCPWRHVMFIDADCIPAVHPNELFADVDVERSGSLFFSDVGFHHPSDWAYVFCGVKKPRTEWETGQFIVDKQRCWMALRWCFWFHEHSDVWFKMVHGDKGLWQLAFLLTGAAHVLSEDCRWEGWGIGQYYKGRMVFSHQMNAKRGSHPWSPHFQAALDAWSALG